MENMNDMDAYIAHKRKNMYLNWNRVLPTNELLWDRWEKAKFLNMGENTSIYDSSVVMGNIEVGANTWIGPFTVLEGINDSISIGDYCHISAGVQIYTHDTAKYVLTNGACDFEKGAVTIGSNTYIGSDTIIAKGVTIGDHCIVGANSFVNKDIPSYSIAFGSPAKLLGEIIIDGNEVTYKYYEAYV